MSIANLIVKRVTVQFRLLTSLLLVFASHAALAASFDCAKVQTKVERLICADAELSRLDEELAEAYATALQDKKQAYAIQDAQKIWLKSRNECVDAGCVQRAHELRMSQLIAGGVEAMSGTLYGKWEGGGKAASSIYGTMEISKSKITWKGHSNVNPRCTVTYQQVKEDYGVEFKDQTDNVYVTAPDSTFKTYLLKINGGKCAMGLTHFRMTLRADLPGYLEFIEYEELTNIVGRMHFFRQD
jgi:uncharacterized protein